jgi:hypothetical protein
LELSVEELRDLMLGNDPSQWTTDLYQNEDRETSIKKKT